MPYAELPCPPTSPWELTPSPLPSARLSAPPIIEFITVENSPSVPGKSDRWLEPKRVISTLRLEAILRTEFDTESSLAHEVFRAYAQIDLALGLESLRRD